MIDRVMPPTEKTFDKLYKPLIDSCYEHGTELTPRGQRCIELRPFHFCLLNPRRALYNGLSRKLFFRFYAIETLGYLAGLEEPWYGRFLATVNKQFEQYLRSDGKLHGAYGPKIIESIREIVQMLEKDPDSRQSVSSIWEPGIPNHPNLECTLSLQFMTHLIKGKHHLCMSTTMRSNDLNWVTPYDVPAFCAIQIILANVLDMEIGPYYHNAGSLHIYKENPPEILPYERDSWLKKRVRVPIIKEEHYSESRYVRITRICRECHHFLQHLQIERANNVSWQDLTMPRQIHYIDYFTQWMRIIKFKWSEVETEKRVSKLDDQSLTPGPMSEGMDSQ